MMDGQEIRLEQARAFPSGCLFSCPRPHLLVTSISRLVRKGIDPALIQLALTTERENHTPSQNTRGLTAVGRQNLRAWGASEDDIRRIQGDADADTRPVELDAWARARDRARKSRESLGPEQQRARNRDAARKYRERKRQEREGVGEPGD